MKYYKAGQEIRNQIINGLERLENEIFYFYGVYNNFFKIDDMILEIIEDPDDGYRSCLGAVCHTNNYEEMVCNFFDKPLGKVKLKKYVEKDVNENSYPDLFDGWILEDIDTKHCWLTFGTDGSDDYYPYFVFTYTPDNNQKEFVLFDENYIPFKERHPELLIKYPSWFDGTRLDFDEP